jgi:hypothetical protein
VLTRQHAQRGNSANDQSENSHAHPTRRRVPIRSGQQSRLRRASSRTSFGARKRVACGEESFVRLVLPMFLIPSPLEESRLVETHRTDGIMLTFMRVQPSQAAALLMPERARRTPDSG